MDFTAHVMRPVAKKSAEKAGSGGRKWAFRLLRDGRAVEEHVTVADVEPEVADVRALVVPLVTDGVTDPAHTGVAGAAAARAHHATVVAELPLEAMRLSGGDPAVPTVLA